MRRARIRGALVLGALEEGRKAAREWFESRSLRVGWRASVGEEGWREKAGRLWAVLGTSGRAAGVEGRYAGGGMGREEGPRDERGEAGGELLEWGLRVGMKGLRGPSRDGVRGRSKEGC